jgi:hypothetical protein
MFKKIIVTVLGVLILSMVYLYLGYKNVVQVPYRCPPDSELDDVGPICVSIFSELFWAISRGLQIEWR